MDGVINVEINLHIYVMTAVIVDTVVIFNTVYNKYIQYEYL
uniref:Uncharacterized protein n=1 Tax=Staphylococcus caeli TaxID=2201815 RepID=A0A2U8RLL3_9STAP|nr:hypothetical protein SCC82B_00030 [Staphylococcus caeli]